MLARDYINDLASTGRYHFTSSDARRDLGVSPSAARLALNRLTRKDLIAQPARGFYVIVPPEYRTLGCLPPTQFIPTLMRCRNRHYYAGLLSAAEFHGVAHHRPQLFQVFVEESVRPIDCGQVRVIFIVRRHLQSVPVQCFNTPRGPIRVSTPEATAVDLVGYHRRVGGLDQVATVLSELTDQINPERLVSVARTAPIAWSQRLGYLLSQVNGREQAALLKAYVKDSARQSVPLLPGMADSEVPRDADWKLLVNVEVEPDL